MNLEHQVVSLHLAKRLKELGVKQGSYFYWRGVTWNTPEAKTAFPVWELRAKNYREEREGYRTKDIVAAFTVAELGEMLPQLQFDKKHCVVCSYQFAGTSGYACDIVSVRGGGYLHREMGLTEADARAKMLVYLLENKLISV
jgi:hypothetical protein